MGIYSFDGGSLWTNEGPEDETPGYYFEHKNTSRDEPIELDINDPEYQEKIGPAVDELTRRANVRFPGIDHWKTENIGPKSPDSA